MGYFRDNIEQMAGYVPGFQPKEAGYIKLNTNENPYPPSPRAIESLVAVCDESLRKYPDPMGEEFRAAAAELYGVEPECVLFTFGSDEALTLAVRAFCAEGDVLAYPYPSYSLYEVLGEIQGARCVSVDFPEDFSLPPMLAETGARLTLISNPNAPTGTCIPAQELASLASSLDGVLLIDEAYVDFAQENCLHLAQEFPNVIVSRTLSKSYSLAGLRCGFCTATRELVQGLTKVKDSYNVSTLNIVGASAALRDQEWFRENVENIRASRRRLTAALEGLGFFCWPSQANFVLARAPKGRSAARLYEQLFERKILVRYFKARRLDDCLRITVGRDHEIDALLEALRDILGT